MKNLNDSNMLKDTVSVTFLLILSSVLGFIAQISLVSSFGASVEMDVYFKLLAVPTIITGITPMIFSSVLIPTFAKFKSDLSKIIKFIDSIWMFIMILAIFFSLIGFSIFYINIDLFVPKSHHYLNDIAIQVSLMIWIGSGFSIMSSFMAAILNYNKQFYKVVWTSLFPPFFIITFVLFFHEKLGIRSISLGFCIAFILQFIVFLKASKVSLNFSSFNIKNIQHKRLLLKQSFLVVMSLLPFTILVPIAYFWANQLEKGSISYLGYSQSFAGFLSVTVGMGITIVSFPDLADKFAKGNGVSSLYKFEQKLRYVLLIAMFAAGAFISLRIPILTLLYQRGSFNAESVNNLASVLPWYLIAGIFVAGLNLLRTLFYSKGEFKVIAILGLIMPVLFFVLSGILKEKFSYVGIGIANTITFAVLFCMSVFLLKNKKAGFLSYDFVFFSLKIIFITIISSFITVLSFKFISNLTFEIVSIFICLFLFSIVYFFCSKFIFQLQEIEKIKFILLNKIKFLNR